MIVVFQNYKNSFTSAPREPGSPGKVPVPAAPCKTNFKFQKEKLFNNNLMKPPDDTSNIQAIDMHPRF